MKKFFLFCMMALVTMCGLNSCSDDCDHEFIEVDYSKDIVGTWTYLAENGQAEVMVIKADGSFAITGVRGDGALYEETGTIKVVNNKVTLAYASGEVFEGRLELVTGKSMSIVLNKEYDVCLTYDYCEEDLSDEIVGMWVCMQEAFGQEEEMVIQTFDKNGISLFTGYVPDANGYIKEAECNYKVIGDLLITSILDSNNNPVSSVAIKIDITPNAIEYGDIMATYNPVLNTNSTFLRIKQYLELPGMKYDYIKTFVTNVKGLDKDIEFMGTTFNFAKMDGVKLDKMLKAVLFSVEFPDANTIKYGCYYNGQNMSMEAPIVVDGNKMTVKMSEKNPALKDVDLYTFQDQDNTQMHMYMHSTGFEKFFGNMQVTIMEQMGLLDTTDAAAVKAVFDSIDEAVETINVSFVMTKAAR